MRDRLIVEQLLTSAWALHPPTLQALAGIVLRHAAGAKLSAIQIQQTIDANGMAGRNRANGRGYSVIEGIAVVPVHGVISKHAAQVEDISAPQGTSCDEIARNIGEALDAPHVNAIMLDVYSPGGSVDGVADLSDIIHNASIEKPIIAHIDDLGASGAYWLASQCNSIYVNETGVVGSIGVYTVVLDESKFYAEELLTTVHVIQAGEFKGTGTPGTVLTEEQVDDIQRRVDALYNVFCSHIARGLKISKSAARAMADGRVHVGAEARAAGLVDGIQSFDTTLEDMIQKFSHRASAGRRDSSIHSPIPPGDYIMNASAKFNEKVRVYQEKHKCPRSTAVAAVARQNPDLHEATLDQGVNRDRPAARRAIAARFE
jgi:signal peptide peptidase SppA